MGVGIEAHHGVDADRNSSRDAAGNTGRNAADAARISGDCRGNRVVMQHGGVRISGAGRKTGGVQNRRVRSCWRRGRRRRGRRSVWEEEVGEGRGRGRGGKRDGKKKG